ncbi:hypothetical protein CLV47_10130 [Antricoccus suffuscus]|uniref:Uncharacterized protein n=1 Tax=Antricoccus suffuscus TaxID=1629062 RepID=A0A2T1A5P1_9ACTN|nr:hypothetical protein CLV47_10130 [Antricoccus suffuscus]
MADPIAAGDEIARPDRLEPGSPIDDIDAPRLTE